MEPCKKFKLIFTFRYLLIEFIAAPYNLFFCHLTLYSKDSLIHHSVIPFTIASLENTTSCLSPHNGKLKLLFCSL